MDFVEFLKNERGIETLLPDIYGEWLGYQIEEVCLQKGFVRTSLKVRQDHLSPSGAVHGGVISGFLDFTCGCAVFAVIDSQALRIVESVASRLPDSIVELDNVLNKKLHRQDYDAAANLANAMVWDQVNAFFQRPDLTGEFCDFCRRHFPQAGLSRIIRVYY